MLFRKLASRYLRPDQYLDSIEDIDLAKLCEEGARGLIIDIDNTLLAPGTKAPDGRMLGFIDSARDAGLDICLLSNASRRRVAWAASGTGLFAIAGARKPSGRGFEKAMRLMGLAPPQLRVIGDQLFTDVLGARRLGIGVICVRPITRREEPTVRLKRIAEYFIMRDLAKSRAKGQVKNRAEDRNTT
ncbi:MAG: YqeG family HAD IIIA-type phosphatase [Oscillospiraceae bacterium]|nr:YqeG family HAD IIIA-type phosphatase [Oscillospiraceae bacterium]